MRTVILKFAFRPHLLLRTIGFISWSWRLDKPNIAKYLTCGLITTKNIKLNSRMLLIPKVSLRCHKLFWKSDAFAFFTKFCNQYLIKKN